MDICVYFYKKHEKVIERSFKKGRTCILCGKDVLKGVEHLALLSFFGVTMQFSDFLDLLFLTVIFYVVFRFIKQKRAIKLVFGVVVIVLIAVLSSVLNMEGISFLLENLFQVGIIALIIVFQPELRMALEKMGDQPIKGLKNITEQKSNDQTHEMIKSIVVAVDDMSAKQTGALIIIEKTTTLEGNLTEGIIIDAAPSPALIKNIFYNKAPLHDGAMVFRNNRINRAGCFVKSTQRIDIPEELGSRHRAAIGISEESDAIVIVVSEETGTVSVVRDGDITRGYDKNSLMQELMKEFKTDQGAPKTAKEAIKGKITKRLGKFQSNEKSK